LPPPSELYPTIDIIFNKSLHSSLRPATHQDFILLLPEDLIGLYRF
jgi:hypothetical protein